MGFGAVQPSRTRDAAAASVAGFEIVLIGADGQDLERLTHNREHDDFRCARSTGDARVRRAPRPPQPRGVM